MKKILLITILCLSLTACGRPTVGNETAVSSIGVSLEESTELSSISSDDAMNETAGEPTDSMNTEDMSDFADDETDEVSSDSENGTTGENTDISDFTDDITVEDSSDFQYSVTSENSSVSQNGVTNENSSVSQDDAANQNRNRSDNETTGKGTESLTGTNPAAVLNSANSQNKTTSKDCNVIVEIITIPGCTTESTTRPSTESGSDCTTEPAARPSTDSTTEAVTDSSTEEATTPSTKPSTDSTPESSTEAAPDASTTAPSSSEGTSLEMEAFDMINAIRVQNGLNALEWDTELYSCTNIRAEEASRYWSHTRPDGSSWYTVNPSIFHGENLAYGYKTASSVVDGWMNSTGHRENILNSRYTRGSLSLYKSDSNWYWCFGFGY